MNIQILDNFLNNEEINTVHDTIFNDLFNWFIAQHQHTVNPYDLNISQSQFSKNLLIDYFQFCHPLYYLNNNTSIKVSNYSNIADLIINKLSKFNNVYYKIIRAKINLQTQNNKTNENTFNAPHTDMDENHYVLIYYVNDTDGCTFLFDNDNNVVHKVYPKKGRALLFNGNIKHASGHPVNSLKRCVINFNLTL
jgi:hypothetical protein